MLSIWKEFLSVAFVMSLWGSRGAQRCRCLRCMEMPGRWMMLESIPASRFMSRLESSLLSPLEVLLQVGVGDVEGGVELAGLGFRASMDASIVAFFVMDSDAEWMVVSCVMI